MGIFGFSAVNCPFVVRTQGGDPPFVVRTQGGDPPFVLRTQRGLPTQWCLDMLIFANKRLKALKAQGFPGTRTVQ